MSRRYLKCRENSEPYLSQSQIIKMKAVQYFRGLSEMVQSSTILCIIPQIIFHLARPHLWAPLPFLNHV